MAKRRTSEQLAKLREMGERFALARSQSSLTAAELGARVGVDRNTIYRWEAAGQIAEIDGKRVKGSEPGALDVEAVSRATGVTTDWLLRGVSAPAVRDILDAWYGTARGKLASAAARVFLENLPLAGYVPGPSFYDNALVLFEHGLSPERAAQAARETEIKRAS